MSHRSLQEVVATVKKEWRKMAGAVHEDSTQPFGLGRSAGSCGRRPGQGILRGAISFGLHVRNLSCVALASCVLVGRHLWNEGEATQHRKAAASRPLPPIFRCSS